MADVRTELRRRLESAGFTVADDTISSRGELYVKGSGDLAGALFEFATAPLDAFEKMYQGSWTEGLPPRFAVLPAAAQDDPSFELLEQARIVPLLYEVRDSGIEFSDFDAVERRVTR